MSHLLVTVGGKSFRLSLCNTLVEGHRTFRTKQRTRPYITADIIAVHRHGCPAKLPEFNPAHGPCECGGQAVFDALMKGIRARPTSPLARRRRSEL